MYFDAAQITQASWAFSHAEKVVARYYRMSEGRLQGLRYDVKTLAYLEEPEINERAFAQLCRYKYEPERGGVKEDSFSFYRVCLQDNRILDAVNRTAVFVKLPPLLFYIATHELVHVIRFDAGEENFEASWDAKELEERRGSAITREMLSNLFYPGLKLILDCFSDYPQVGNLLN